MGSKKNREVLLSANKCLSCGASLKGSRCQYCGTEYRIADVMVSNRPDPYHIRGGWEWPKVEIGRELVFETDGNKELTMVTALSGPGINVSPAKMGTVVVRY